MKDKLKVTRWSLEQWLASEAQHNELLQRSTADALFQSFSWLSVWWHSFGRPEDSETVSVYAAHDADRLIGLMPLHHARTARRWPLNYKSASFLGNRLRESRGVPTEYQDVIAEQGREQDVREACLRAFLADNTDAELSIGWTKAAPYWQKAFAAQRGNILRHTRTIDPQTSYQANLSEGFIPYTKGLSANARRALLNQRSQLLKQGNVVSTQLPPSNFSGGLVTLNALHSTRWGKPAFSGKTLQFHERLAAEPSENFQTILYELSVDGEVVSSLFDIRCGKTQYNIQMGFDDSRLSGLSLGILHLGYAIEDAAGAGVDTYDFLGGSGQSTNYKARYATQHADLLTLQTVLTAPLAALYGAYDLMATRNANSTPS